VNLPKAYDARELRGYNHHDGSGLSGFSIAGIISERRNAEKLLRNGIEAGDTYK